MDPLTFAPAAPRIRLSPRWTIAAAIVGRAVALAFLLDGRVVWIVDEHAGHA